MKRRLKLIKPNSGNTKVQGNKITQYFTQAEGTTDHRGIGIGELKGKSGERVKPNKFTHKENQGIKIDKQLGQGQVDLQTP